MAYAAMEGTTTYLDSVRQSVEAMKHMIPQNKALMQQAGFLKENARFAPNRRMQEIETAIQQANAYMDNPEFVRFTAMLKSAQEIADRERMNQEGARYTAVASQRRQVKHFSASTESVTRPVDVSSDETIEKTCEKRRIGFRQLGE